MNKEKRIVEYMNEILPNARCELNYEKDYELLIATMLSAQTTDKRVNEVTKVLFHKYDTLEKLASADVDDVMNIIHSVGTYHKKSRNVISISKALLEKSDGKVPNDREFLESLDGVGRKTTNVVLSNLYEANVIAVDTHVARVSKRLGLSKENDDVYTIERKLNRKFSKKELGKLHHQLVLFGRYFCKAQKPECGTCKLQEFCKYKKESE